MEVRAVPVISAQDKWLAKRARDRSAEITGTALTSINERSNHAPILSTRLEQVKARGILSTRLEQRVLTFFVKQ